MTADDRSYCLWRATPAGDFCYGVATHAVERLSGQVLGHACEQHSAPAQWARLIQGSFRIIPRAQWIAEGRGCRGPVLGS